MSGGAGPSQGVLIAVVGPSGAGKDTLIAAARTALAGDQSFAFPERIVTRAVDPALEVHESVSDEDFDRREARGEFAIAWRSHGNAYGLPKSVAADVERGLGVVVNVSRAVVGALRQRFARVAVIHVSARPQILARRLCARGRESPQQIAARVARAGEAGLPPPPVTLIDNSGDVAEASAQFVQACLDAVADQGGCGAA